MVPRGQHIPVLGRELVELAAPEPGDTVIDGTFGVGGHARMLAERMEWSGTYVAIDRDPTVRPFVDGFTADGRERDLAVRHLQQDFAGAFRTLARKEVSAAVVILDLGTSSLQLDQPERGFAYAYDAPLDMRMDPTGGITAGGLVASADEAELVRILFEYGEERHARRIARELVRRRAATPIERTGQLVDAVEAAVPRALRRPGHVAKRTFQALRIAVNDELGMVDHGLDAALDLLVPGGRLAVISFHSLEDRIVKRRFRDWLGRCTCPPGLPVCACGAHARVALLTRKPVVPTAAEVAANPRAASAKLRAVRRLEDVA